MQQLVREIEPSLVASLESRSHTFFKNFYPDDVAVDWIGNNLYWTDAVWARIEVLNLNTGDRAEVLRTGANTNPRAIAVDPTTRYIVT